MGYVIKTVDLLIHARWIIPVEPASITHKKYALVIHNGAILDILPSTVVAQKYKAHTVEQRDNHILIPGLINSHTHAGMSLLRGIADDLSLTDWLHNHIWPLEKKWASESFVKDGTDLAIAEMLRGGTTCFNDMYLFPDISAQQAIQHGIRASIGLVLIEFPSAWATHSEEYLQKGLALHKQLQQQPLITASFAPHSPYAVGDKNLIKIKKLADKYSLSIHMHLHETAQEIKQQQQKTAQTPLQRLQQLGLLSHAFMAVHMTQLSDQDMQLLAQTGVHIIHCPKSNLKLASGLCPVARCLDANINVALGTDSVASNNSLDMFAEMQMAALLAKGVAGDARVVPAKTALEMATINGAKALGIANETGSLCIGKSADVVAVDLNQLETQPIYDPLSHLVYATNRQQVSDVWVAGKQLLKHRKLTTIDTDELKTRVLAWQKHLIKCPTADTSNSVYIDTLH